MLLGDAFAPSFDAADGKVSGRTDDMMIVRGVNVFPTQIEELILDVAGLSPHDQLILPKADLSRLAHRPA